MNTKNIFSSLVLFLSLLFLTKLLIIKRNKKKNNLPPSPPNSLPILGHLRHFKKPLHQSLARLSARHGPILLLRFGIRRVLLVSSASLAEECFTTNDLAFANRPKLPSATLSSYQNSSIGTAPYGPMWRDMRRMAAVQALAGHRLSFFSCARADEAKALARQLFLDSAREDFTKVELRSRLFGLSMNVMLKMMVGKRYDWEEPGNDDARRFKELVGASFAFAGASNIGDFLPSVLGWFARRRAESILAEVHTFWDKFMQALIEERRVKMIEEEEEEEEERIYKTMIDAIFLLQRTHPKQYEDYYIKSLLKVSNLV